MQICVCHWSLDVSPQNGLSYVSVASFQRKLYESVLASLKFHSCFNSLETYILSSNPTNKQGKQSAHWRGKRTSVCLELCCLPAESFICKMGVIIRDFLDSMLYLIFSSFLVLKLECILHNISGLLK